MKHTQRCIPLIGNLVSKRWWRAGEITPVLIFPACRQTGLLQFGAYAVFSTAYQDKKWSKGRHIVYIGNSHKIHIYAICLSSNSLYFSGGSSPLTLSTCSQSLKIITVGSAVIPCFCASSNSVSVSTFATIAFHAYFSDKCGINLPRILHGPHHSA